MTYAERFCRAKRERMIAILKSAGTRTKPATAAPVPSPLPIAGAANNSAAWFLSDLGLDDEQMRRIRESW